MAAGRKVDHPRVSVESEPCGIEGPRGDPAVRDGEEDAPVAPGQRRIHGLRFRSEERGSGPGCRTVDAPEVDTSPLVDRGVDEVEEVDAIRQERGPAVGVLALRDVEERGRFRLAAGRGHARQRGVDHGGREHDDPGPAPCAATSLRCVADPHRRATRQRHLHQAAIREVAERPAVRRPERLLCALGARDHRCLEPVQGANEEASARRVRRGEGDRAAVGGDDGCSVQLQARGKRPGEARHPRGARVRARDRAATVATRRGRRSRRPRRAPPRSVRAKRAVFRPTSPPRRPPARSRCPAPTGNAPRVASRGSASARARAREECRAFASSGESCFRIAVITSAVVSPLNGRSPDSISWNTDPKAKMSERWSAGSPRTCSGDM